ncbi:MAG: hypothetical protein LZF85_06005 [Nitrosomonas sp.]|uniref:hypothetical protein n=1 Tax=Nitrosomonas sp. TaxID=42353 RepID=UPI0025DDDA0F|nr:hypothetical protein [Nitrosomonas sp.]UJP03988.1 MAG: hypothetical protein LZF85_06005 [Nitrosomonas sp.]
MQNRTTILKAGAYTGFAGAAIFIVQAVFTSTSSTAAIGLIMIPFYGFPAAGAGWALVYSAFALLDLRSGKASWNSRNVQFAAVFLAVFVLAGLGFFAQQRVLAVAKNPASTPQALEVVNQRWIPWGRQGVEIALAQHPSTPPAILEKLAMSGDDAVVQQAGANANMPLAALEGIAAGPLTYERVTGLAGNQKISHAIMEKLIAAAMNDSHAADPVRQGLYKTYVLSALAANAALPQDLFERVAAGDSPTHFLVLAVINAPRASCLQMSGLLVSAPALENASLYNTILSKMTGKDCFVEN